MFSLKRVFQNLSLECVTFCISITNSKYYVARGRVVSAIDYKTNQETETIVLSLPIYDLKVTKCGGFLLAACDECTGLVVDLKTKKITMSLNGHTDVVNCIIECEDNYVLTCSWDNTIRRWNRLTGECIRTYSGHSDWVRSIAYDMKTKRFISGSDDRMIIVWNAETGEQIGVLKEISYSRRSLTFVNDTQFISSSGENALKIWDITTMKEVKTMSSHTNFILSVALTPDSQYVITGSWGHIVNVWSFATGECVATIPDVGYHVGQVEVSADGKYIFVSSCNEHGYKIYEVEPAFSCVVHKFNAQVGIKRCTLKLLTDGSIVNEKGENIEIN